MRIVPFILFLSNISIVLPFPNDNNSQLGSVTAAESDKFPVVEHNGIVVTLIEESVSRSPNGKQVVTSFLFMIENRNEKPGQHSHSAPLRFFSNDEKLVRDASYVKTGGATSQYQPLNLPRFDDLPKPVDDSKTLLVEHWIHGELPKAVFAVEADFGQDGNNKTYRFPLRKR